MFRIFLAEDNPGDVLLFREALKSRNFPFTIELADDGQKAIQMIKGWSEGAAENRPDLVVLDVNLPKHNGDEILKHLRAQPSLSSVQVIMLTSSSSPTDKARAGSLGANLYLQKPSDLEGLMDVARVIEDMLKGTQRV
jgi:CheY-like chemotaxis protein